MTVIALAELALIRQLVAVAFSLAGCMVFCHFWCTTCHFSKHQYLYNQFGHGDPVRCRKQIAVAFLDGLEQCDPVQQERFLEKRVSKIVESA
ncbi:MAG: hypothetical protein RQ746_02850 [Bacteroidales bacterium]|nr:hypothetical protein [Bacteroidales bacterium]